MPKANTVFVGYHGHGDERNMTAAATFFAERHSGLVDQMELLSHGLARACRENASLVSGPFFTSVFGAQLAPWSVVLPTQQTNAMLRSVSTCGFTRLLPSSCLTSANLLRGDANVRLRCPINVRDVRGNKDALAGELLARFKVGEQQLAHSWTASLLARARPPTHAAFRFDSPYNAVHLNLDVDWLYFAVNRSAYREWRRSDESLRRQLSSACRRDADPVITSYARRAVELLAVHTLASFAATWHLPIVVATAIGKPGHEDTQCAPIGIRAIALSG
jgi:hypothetical protein